MRIKNLVFLVLSWLLWTQCFGLQKDRMSEETRRRIVYNDDGMKLFEAGRQDRLEVETFLRQRLATEVTAVPITTYSFCVALPDICKHDSRVGEVYGERYGEDFDQAANPDVVRANVRAIRALRAKGTDVLKLLIGELKPRGIEVLAGVRMNDTHHPANKFREVRAGMFAIDHPEYVVRQPDGRTNEAALDYSHPEVRTHRLAIMRELAENYDSDGLELDFCRWPKYFPRDQGVEKAPIMTGFVGQIREMLNWVAQKRGRKRLTLGVRVPETIRTCWLAGLDVETWVQKGWIDYLVVSTWNEIDPQLKVDDFARFTRGHCQLLAHFNDMLGGMWTGLPKITGRGVAQNGESYAGMALTAAEARACAHNYYSWGADGVFFWNVASDIGDRMDTEQRKRNWEWMNAIISPERALSGTRRYHYLPLYKWSVSRRPPTVEQPSSSTVTRSYAWYGPGQSPLGTMKTQIIRFPPESVGQRQVYRFRMADGRNGEKLNGKLRFPIFYVEPGDKVEIDINGRPVDSSKVKRIPCPSEMGLPGTWFEMMLADCPAFRGDNELGVILHNRREREAVPYLEELDIVVQ